MTTEADAYTERLKQLATMETAPKVDALPWSDDPLPPIHDHAGGPKMVKKTTALLLALALALVSIGGTAAVFVFSQSMTGNVGSTPANGPVTLSLGTLPPCTNNCNGTKVSGPNGYAIVFTVTAINAVATTSDTGFSALWLVPTTLQACGLTQGGTGWVQVPQTQGAITVQPQQYNYCVFYTALTGGQSLSIQITYSV